MFTGIVEELGTVQSIAAGAKAGKITIGADKVLEGLRMGDSIAVNGICLTVVGFDKQSFTADVMPETIRRTALAELKGGSRVNLERALLLLFIASGFAGLVYQAIWSHYLGLILGDRKSVV